MADAAHYETDALRTSLDEIMDKVDEGEEVAIDRSGQPIAKVIPLHPKVNRRGQGAWKGRVVISDDFDDPDEEIERMFGTGL